MKLELCELGPDAYGLESLSPACLKVHRALQFYGFSYERLHAMRPSDHKKYNPTGQVPVLLIDGKPVPDSTEILKVLEGMSSKSLVPLEERIRAEAWLWEDYSDQVMALYVFASRWFDKRNWRLVREENFGALPRYLRSVIPNFLRKCILKRMSRVEIIRDGEAKCWQGFQRCLDLLEDRAPDDGYWMGGAMSVADISLFSSLHSLRSELSKWQMEEIDKRPKLSAWLDRVDLATT